MADTPDIQVVIANPANIGGVRKATDIKYLVYHYTANDGDTAIGNAKYYNRTVLYTSAHYFVDDRTIVQSVPDLKVAWAVGGSKWSDCDTTGGGTMYGIIKNTNSIHIEMCDTVHDGKLMASDATLTKAIELGKYLMKKYNITLDRVYRHFDVTGKHCPAYFMDNAAWEAFKLQLSEDGEEEMQIYHWFDQMPEWARPSAEKAFKKGLIKADATTGAVNVYEVNLQPLVWMDRLGMLD